MKTYYHGSEYPIKELRNQPMFFTDSEEFAKSLEWLGVEGKLNRYVYSAELEYTKPFIITSEEEYEERMMDMPCFENDEDALIYPAEGKTPEYIVVKDATKQVKNFKLVKHVYEDKQKPIKAYHSGNLEKGIHAGHLFFTDDRETAELYGKENGGSKTYLCELTFKNPLVMDDVEYDEFMQNMTDWNEPIRQGYDSIISPEEGGATYYIALKPEEQVKIKKTMDINERLESMDGCYITSSPYDIVNLFKNKPKEYRVLYDKNIDMYMIGEAENYTHYDMVNKAYRDAYYYNMEDFIQEIGGTIDNYTELGQSGFWDGDTEEENFDAYLWYIVFSPNDEWTLGTDGYDKRYDYPFGHVFTRGCDLDEIGLCEALGVPQNSEKLNESEEKNLNDNFWKWFGDSKVVDKQGKPLEVYHGTNQNFDTFKLSYSGKINDYGMYGKGFYFTDDINVAKAFSGKGDTVIKICYLSLQNPLILNNQNEEALMYKSFEKEVPLNIEEDNLAMSSECMLCLREWLIGKGYDGVISYRKEKPEEFNQFVAFYPNQIKAVNNKGIWSDNDNIYEHLNEEEYKYIDNIEVLKLSPSDDMKVYRNFAKDFTNLRALIKGEDIYLWDAKQATHDQIADGLFGEDSELDNQFMFDTKYKELDDYSIRNTIDMYKFDKGTALGEKWYNDFFKYYEIIKNRLGVDFTKEGLEKVEYLKSLKIINGIKEGENIFETLNKEIKRYL